MSATTTPKKAGMKPPPTNTNRPADGILPHLRGYVRANPEVAALWCFGIGFILGWTRKP